MTESGNEKGRLRKQPTRPPEGESSTPMERTNHVYDTDNDHGT